MEYMLLVGIAFWSTLTFVGVRKSFERGGNAFCEKMRDLETAQPRLLIAVGVVAPILGLVMVLIEIGRIQRMVGEVGGFASLGFVLAVVGAAALSSHVAIAAEASD